MVQVSGGPFLLLRESLNQTRHGLEKPRGHYPRGMANSRFRGYQGINFVESLASSFDDSDFNHP